MKLRKLKAYATISALCLSFVFANQAYATSVENNDILLQSTVSPDDEVERNPCAEETTTYKKNENGKWYKRVWSNTRNKWLTDWTLV